MTTKHTPGPWEVKGSGCVGVDCAPNGFAVLFDVNDPALANVDKPTMSANAHLVAAAPDLLAACEAVLGYVDDDYWRGSGLQVRNALWMAIAKAKGESK